MTSVIVKGKYRTVPVSNIDIDSGIDSPSPATLFFFVEKCQKNEKTQGEETVRTYIITY